MHWLSVPALPQGLQQLTTVGACGAIAPATERTGCRYQSEEQRLALRRTALPVRLSRRRRDLASASSPRPSR
eukprot:5566180-Prymnesium_polylepis.1